MANAVSPNPLGAAIYNHYLQQQGRGALPGFIPFQGAEFQYGNGIGDIFRSIGRFLLPILTSTAGGFIGSAAKGLSEGKSLKESAKGALKPSLGAALDSTTSQIMSKFKGGGRRRKRRRRRAKAIPRSDNKLVYKQAGLGRKRKAKRKLTYKKRVRFLPTNF